MEPTVEEAGRENPLRAEKRRKLGELRKRLNPYPHEFRRNHSTHDVHEKFSSLAVGEAKEAESVILAGRLMTVRDMGKAAFFNVSDQSGTIQCYLRLEELPELDREAYRYSDLGDLVGIEGFPFRTKKGELSVHCKRFHMLCKTLEPLPEKYHGLADTEIRYRQRYLDLVMSPETRQVFEKRSQVIREIRNHLDDRGFLEVETPMLQTIYGGASAYPFSTHHRALDIKLFLKISPEMYLKRLIVGGFEKVYEINRNFRNEGIDRSHNPEFTMLEYYEAYTDYNDQMKRFEELVSSVCQKVTGSMKVMYQGKELDFTPPWRRLTVYDALREYTGIDPEGISLEHLFKEVKKRGGDREKMASRGEMLMDLFDLAVEEHLFQPTFIMDHPIEISPLTKVHRHNPHLVERFEPVAAHMEIGNAYTELNDPEDQRERLKAQEAQRLVDEEAQPMDEDFLTAIEVGMPPTGGVGIGIDRLVMLLTDQHSIRDVILFPTMRPR